MRPPVNVQELDDRYELYLFAPGLSKTDFLISLQGDLLTIAAKKQGNEADTGKWTRREFETDAFERQFLLNEKIDRDQIAARYEEGVLLVSMAKLPWQEGPKQEIVVA